MRSLISAVVMSVGLSLASVPSVVAAPIGSGGLSSGVLGDLVMNVQYWGGGGRCERLRRACLFKEERGEVGEGNCRRYREECRTGPSYCERLRRACYYKEERGEVGEGNCRRYRSQCQRPRW